MEKSPPGIGQAFNDGVALFSKHAIMVIVGALIYMGIAVVGGMIPFVNFLFFALVMPVLIGGALIFFLNVAKGKEPKFEDIFSSFSDYVTWLGAYWLLVAYCLLYGIPAFVLIGLGFLIKGCFGGGLIVIGYIGWIVILVIFVLKWYFYMFIIADDWHEGSIKGAFDKSVLITKDRLLEVFLVALVMGLFAGAGGIVFGIGALITMPIAMLGLASYYLRIKEEYLVKSGEAPPAHAAPLPPESVAPPDDAPAFEVDSNEPPPG
jgi:hypothetical protein